MAKLFGESIPEYVVTQLQKREEILGADGLQGIRTERDLQYLTQKGAWIRMISGTDVELDNPKGEYTSKLAENFILSGGVLKWNSQTKKFERNTNFSTNSDPGKYSLTSDLGIRPEPGITSFGISHKNTWGTIREASISFTIWTLDDLQKTQALFLRPGAQVIIEWGNSLFVNNEGEIEDIPVYENLNDFFKNSSVEKIYQNINYLKSQTFGNYDAFLGLVTNFNWNYRKDGGFDCQIRVISRSGILESISLLGKPVKDTLLDDYEASDVRVSLLHTFIYASKFLREKEEGEGIWNVDDLKLNFKSIPDELQEIIEQDSGFSTLGVTNVGTRASLLKKIKKTVSVAPLLRNRLSFTGIEEEIGSGTVLRLTPSQEVEDFIKSISIFGFNGSTEEGSNPMNFRYISLRSLLFLVNTAFLINETQGFDIPLFFVGEELTEAVKENIQLRGNITEQKYKTFEEHFSLDPYIAIIPKIPTFNFSNVDKKKIYLKNVNKETLKKTYGYNVSSDPGKVIPFQVMPNLVSRNIENSIPVESRDNILNIFVNLEMVKEVLDTYFSKDGEPQEANVLDFVKTILGRIQSALGNINSFDLHFDNDIQKWIVVDRNSINEDLVNSSSKIAVIKPTGLKSTISEINLQSKITSQLVSTIAISGQATKPDDIQSDISLINWNRGTKNRFYIPKVNVHSNPAKSNSTFTIDLTQGIAPTSNTSAQVSKEDDKEKNSILEFLIYTKEGFNSLNKLNTAFFKSKYKKEFFDRIKGEGSVIFKKLYAQKQFNKTVGYGTVLKPQQTTVDSSLNVSTGSQNKKQIEDTGVVPIELSLTFDGIGGFKIGQIFKLGTETQPSNILPDIYNKYGFIITGIEDSIGTDGKWNTTIKALTFKTG